MSSTVESTKSFGEKEGGALLRVLGTLLVLALVLVGLFFFVFGKIVPPNFIGVRQNYFWPFEKGYVKDGLEPGLHWKIPGISNVILLPRTFQFVHFNNEKQVGELELPELEVPTLDGSRVRTDITMILRFDAKKDVETVAPEVVARRESVKSDVAVPLPEVRERNHGGPKELLTTLTDDPERRLRTLSMMAENKLRQSLSELSTTDYYNPELREKAAINAQSHLNAEVNVYGIEVSGIFIRRYIYVEKAIDDQIFLKNLQDQTERLSREGSLLAKAKAKTENERALWDAKIRNLEVEGQSKVQVAHSEGDLYEAKKRAEGDLLVATASADIDAARAHALSDGPSAEVYIAREMAPLIETLRGGVITGLDPYNINQWVERLTPK